MKHRGRALRGGFTLVEMMVVVVLMALITTAVGLAVLSQARRASTRDSRASSLVALQQPPLRVSALADGIDVSPPRIEQVGVEVDLASDPVIDGASVESRFDARVVERFHLVQSDLRATRVRVEFAFPTGMSGARDVSLRVGVDGARPTEAHGAAYSPQAIVWEGALGPSASLDALIAYTAQGNGAFACEIGGGARVERVDAVVRLAPGTRPIVPASSLAPTTVSPERIEWTYDNLVTSRALLLELPASESPLGRAALLCRLAALAVLVFGLGFWYLADLRAPGCLDDFRWGHFLLLTSNHVLFFVSFAVLGLWLAPSVAFALAAAPSLTLLTLHVARVTDSRFATRRALPLAALSFVIVTAVVYAPALRPLIALVTVLGAAAYVTVTWQRWAAGRARYESAESKRVAREVREYKLTKAFDALAEARAAGAVALDAADRTLARTPVAGAARGACDDAARGLRRALDEAAETREARATLRETDDDAHDDKARSLEARARALTASLVAQTEALRALDEALQKTATVSATARDETHCAACGAAVSPSHAHCPACGVAAALTVPCAACDARWTLPTALLRRDHAKKPLHCARCGAPSRTV